MAKSKASAAADRAVKATAKATAKAKTKATASARAAKAKFSADDEAALDVAIYAAEYERKALADAAAAAARRAAHEEEAAAAAAATAAAAGIRAEDVPDATVMPALTLPPALPPSLLKLMSNTNPTASVGSGGASGKRVDYATETARERELRMREARVKLKMARKAYTDRRSGKRALTHAANKAPPPPVYYGDETSDEIAARPQLVQEYMRRYAEWLVRHMRETRLLENPTTCPDHFALLYRFNATADPVVRNPKSSLGHMIEVLILCYKRVLYYVWSDYVDGLLAAALKEQLDVTMSQFNVVELLPGGVRPSGLGVRMTKLAELSKMPPLSDEAYPQGIPCELVLKGAAWGSDLGGATASKPPMFMRRAAAAATAAASAATDDDDDDVALDTDSDDDGDKKKKDAAASAALDPVAEEIRKEVRRIGAARFPLSQTILNAFKPDYEATPTPSALEAGGADSDDEDDEEEEDEEA